MSQRLSILPLFIPTNMQLCSKVAMVRPQCSVPHKKEKAKESAKVSIEDSGQANTEYRQMVCLQTEGLRCSSPLHDSQPPAKAELPPSPSLPLTPPSLPKMSSEYDCLLQRLSQEVVSDYTERLSTLCGSNGAIGFMWMEGNSWKVCFWFLSVRAFLFISVAYAQLFHSCISDR